MEQREKEENLKKELESHLEKAAKRIKDQNGDWLNLADICERELNKLAEESDLKNDKQTGYFCKFVALSTNFASMNFVERMHIIPNMVDNLHEMLGELKKEIGEFAEIAKHFAELINAFVAIVIETQHNMSLALPYLENSTEYLAIMSDAFKPDSNTQLTLSDLSDINQSLDGLSEGISKLLNHAKQSNEKSVQLDMRVDSLKADIQKRIKINRDRLSFEDNFAKLGSGLGLNLGLTLGLTTANFILESSAFGGAGALALGGLAFPPLSVLLFGAAIGSISIGSIVYLCKYLWQRKNYRALEYLNRILEDLNKLKSANLMFMHYMNKSEEESTAILAKLDFLKRSLTSSGPQMRKRNSLICNKAIDSTNKMIECIEQVKQININQWIKDTENLNKYSLT